MGYLDINLDNLGGGGGSGVSSLNGQTGPLTLVAGTNITITPGAGTLTISDSGSGFTFPIIAPGGTVTAPSYAFSEVGNDTGIWSSTDGQIDFSNNATLGMSLDPSHNLVVVGNITAANFPVTGIIDSFALYDAAGNPTSLQEFKYDPAFFNGLRYAHHVVPDNSNTYSNLNYTFADYNATLTDADQSWNQFSIEAGVGTDNSGNQIGDYTDVKSTLVFQDITYTSKRTGTDGDVINIEYTPGGTAGSEVVTSPSAFTYVVQIQSGVSTATQIVTALNNSGGPGDLFGSITYAVTGVGSNPQTTAGPSFLSGGANANGSLFLLTLNLYNRNTSNMGNGNGYSMNYDFGNGTDPVKANKFLAYGGNMFIHDNATVQAASAFEYGFSTGNFANSSIQGDLRGVNIYGNPETVLNGVLGYQLSLQVNTSQYIQGFINSVHFTGNVTNSVISFADFSNYDADIGDNYFGTTIQPNINTVDGFFGLNVQPNVTLSRQNSYGVNVGMQNVTPFPGTLATLVIQDITYTAQTPGTGLNGVTFEYVSDTTAGNESATLVGNAVTVHIQSGVSTATQVRAGVLANVVIAANVTVTITGVGSNPQVTAGPQPLAGGTDGATVYSGQFSDGQFHINNGRFVADYVLDTANGAPQQVFNINDLNSGFKVSAGFPMTGGQFGVGNSLSGAVQINDNVGPDITGFHLGYSMAGILTEIEVAAGKTMDALNFISCGAGIGAGSGTITNVTFYRALGLLPEGGTLSVTNQYGFKVDSLFTTLSPTNAWGFYCEDVNADNWFAKNVIVGGITGHATGAFALDVTGNTVITGDVIFRDGASNVTTGDDGSFAHGSTNGPGAIAATGKGSEAAGVAGGSGTTANIFATASGSYARGHIDTASSATISATAEGATATGYTEVGNIFASNSGSFINARLSGGEARSTGEGSVVFVSSDCDATSYVEASGEASIAIIKIEGTGAHATSSNSGTFVSGKVNSAFMESSGEGSFTTGSASGGSIIFSNSDAAYAGGRADGATSIIQSSGFGSFARGSAVNGNTITALSNGSFASGYDSLGSIIAAGDGSHCFGSNLNDQNNAFTFMIGTDLDATTFGQAVYLGYGANKFVIQPNGNVTSNLISWNALGQFNLAIETFTNQTTPATPAAGKVTIFVDSADKHTKQIDETGTVIDLTDGALGTVTSVNGFTGAVVLTPSDIAYTPTTPSDWVVAPTDEQQALDDLAATKSYGNSLSAAITLTDNTASPTTFLSFAKASINNSIIQYSISRNGDFRTGTLYIANNTTVVSLVDNSTETADVGITITATISGANVLVQYTSTSTGFNASLKHIRQQWA